MERLIKVPAPSKVIKRIDGELADIMTIESGLVDPRGELVLESRHSLTEGID